MKNLLLSIIACVISFFATSYGLQKYAQPKPVNDNSIEQTVTETTEDSTIDDEVTPTSESLEEDQETEPQEEYIVNVNIDNLTKDYKKWYAYHKETIELSSEFIAIDNYNSEIEKEDFLSKLKTGLYIPLKVESDELTYKLHKLNEDTIGKKIGKYIRGHASTIFSYFKKEGTSLPKFDWVDLDGNKYTQLNTRGKIKVIKCWFINCVVCVQEFPELNELYDHYEGNDDVQFISLAFDKADKLERFLTKKEFRYPVVAEQKDYISKELEIKQYPAHIIVDEDNNIIKIFNNVNALISTLDQLIGNNAFKSEDDEKKVETQE